MRVRLTRFIDTKWHYSGTAGRTAILAARGCSSANGRTGALVRAKKRQTPGEVCGKPFSDSSGLRRHRKTAKAIYWAS